MSGIRQLNSRDPRRPGCRFRPAKPVDMLAERVVEALGAHLLVGRSELPVQDLVADILQAAGFVVEREPRLSQHDCPDFVVGGRVVVEVKRKTPRNAVLRQLGRYAGHEQVQAIVLASTSSATLRNMRLTLHGVPVYPVILRGSGVPV